MEITIDNDTGSHPVVTLTGRFDAFETEAFRLVIDELHAVPHPTVAIDLHGVQFIDSSALAELVRAMKHGREAQGELLLQRLSDPVRVILELTRLDAAFEIVED